MAVDEFDFAQFLSLLEQRAPRPLSIADMVRMLDIERYDRREIKAALERAVAEQRLRRVGKTRYQWVREPDASVRRRQASGVVRTRGSDRRATSVRVEGRYQRVHAGYGFVDVCGRAAERYPRSIQIPTGAEGGALHGDQVEVEIVRRERRQRHVVGRVVRVITAVHQTVVGRLERTRLGWCVLPELELLPGVDLVGPPFPVREQEGLVARVRITRPATERLSPGGILEEVLGAADDPEVQFLIIAAEHGLRVAFPADAALEASQLPEHPDPQDLVNREDLRQLPFVTIDGETARDFDDAVCLREGPAGERTLWVAIADVSHYVHPATALDREASLRGTSVYFPDRAIPMLPPELSSGLCSLKPHCDRLVLVVELQYDRQVQRRDTRIYRAVIRSRARLTYTQVAGMLSHAETPQIAQWRGQFVELLPQLQLMQALMQELHRQRVQAGSIGLDLPEVLIDLSTEGHSIGVRLLQRNDAHRIIEEFMLEANRAVALELRGKKVPFPYRVHEIPDTEEIDELNQFIGAFGFFVHYDESVRPQDISRVVRQMEGHPLGRVLSRQVVRSLKQARYSALNVGHFGLAFPIYCHFTSPIRRYPDLLVHRQVGRVLDGDVAGAQEDSESIERASVQSSHCERQAMEAEWAMLDLRKCEFMLGHLMEPEHGTIVTVTNFGFFVELDAYPIEGLVRIETLTDDRYTYVEENRTLHGMRTGGRFRLGDRVSVKCTDVSLRRRQIDFVLLGRLPSDSEVEALLPPPIRRGVRGRSHAAQRRKHSRPADQRMRRGRRR